MFALVLLAGTRTGSSPLHQLSAFRLLFLFLFSDTWTAAATRGQISAPFRAESRYTSAGSQLRVLDQASARLNINDYLHSDGLMVATPPIKMPYLTEAGLFWFFFILFLNFCCHHHQESDTRHGHVLRHDGQPFPQRLQTDLIRFAGDALR